ncbi:MAG: arginase [Pseudonocardiales bacterium]|nr:arginase [Pseudonocardiales bacterium]
MMTSGGTGTGAMGGQRDTAPALTAFVGRVGDHNDRAMSAAGTLGEALATRMALPLTTVGTPKPALAQGWRVELDAARNDLVAMRRRYGEILDQGQVPVSAITRCAVAVATLPAIARVHPDAVVLWLDAHADINVPDSSASGYLGGMALSGPAGLWDTGHGAGVDLGRAVLCGARDIDPAERELIDAGRIRHLPIGDGLPERLAGLLSGHRVYFHLDCDVLEPGTVPTDYAVPGGLTLPRLNAIAEVVAAGELVGAEFGEYEGSWADGTHCPPDELLDALSPLLAALTG